MTLLRWASFLPVGGVLIALAQMVTVTVAERIDWWFSAPLILFFGVIITGAGFLPTRIAPNPKIGAIILLTLFLLFEAIALISSLRTAEVYPSVMRIYADVAIVFGAIAGALYVDRAAA